MTRVYRYTFANIDAALVADRLQAAATQLREETGEILGGTITPNQFGFGPWDIEPSVTVESAASFGLVRAALTNTIAALLLEAGEESAYMTVDGAEPVLVYPQALDGHFGFCFEAL